ncbi:MAG: Crp/Fnr family transcriptional regulator [Chloroflexaceae bacterium]|nr:Crp/Fnr family transcriptional regulator [Chloroflexaceae bacterium]
MTSETARSAVLRQVFFFQGLDDQQLHQVAALLKDVRYQRGAIIVHQGDPGGCLYLIVAGRVRIYLAHPDGREVTVRVYGKGAFFGEFSVIDAAPRSASVAALDDVLLLVLYRSDLMDVLQNNFQLVQHLLTILTERLRYTTQYSEQLAFMTAPQRVAATLLQLATAIVPDPSAPIRLELTQHELATLTNTTREWVNRSLRDFAAQQLVQVERGSVSILDQNGLRRLLDG